MNHFLLISAFVLSLLCGLWHKPWQKEFFLAGQQAKSGQVGGSILATCLGASAVFGIVGKASEIGWIAFWWLGSGSLGVLLLGIFWAGPMRRDPDSITLPQWLGRTYGTPARIVAAILITLMWTGVISAQLVAAGSLLQSLAGWPFQLGVVTTAAVTIIYTCLGGQASVLRTDLWQATAIIGGLAVLLLFLFAQAPVQTLTEPLTAAAQNGPSGNINLSAFQWLSLVIVVGGMYLVGPDLYSRVMTANDIVSARRGALLAAAAILGCAVILTYLGIIARITGAEAAVGPEALSWLIRNTLPGPAAILLQIALLTALLSSADTCLLTAASILRLDLLGQGQADITARTGRVRLLVILVGLPAVGIAIFSPRIIGNIMMAYAFYAGGLLVPLLLLRFKVSKKISRPWVWAGMTAGGMVPLLGLSQNWFQASDFMLEQAMAGMTGAVITAAACAAGWFFNPEEAQEKI